MSESILTIISVIVTQIQLVISYYLLLVILIIILIIIQFSDFISSFWSNWLSCSILGYDVIFHDKFFTVFGGKKINKCLL